MFRPWQSFPTMVVSGLLLGILTGGSPYYPGQVATIALVVAMTLALTEIRLEGVSVRTELRAFSHAFVWNYVVLAGIILVIAWLTADADLRSGWIVMAAVPSAIAVIPLTSIFRGNVRSALISSALLYIAALVLVPAITLSFAGFAVPPSEIAFQTFLQIGVPLLASRAIVRVPAIERWRPVGVNLSFFVLVTMVAGANRNAFADPGLVLTLSGAAFARTFGIGLAVLGLASVTHRNREDRIAWTLFASFKNLGLCALLALSLFGFRAAVPAIVALFFEIAWIVSLQRLLRAKAGSGVRHRTT